MRKIIQQRANNQWFKNVGEVRVVTDFLFLVDRHN